MTLRRRIPRASYPPDGMTRSRPVDTTCPLCTRVANDYHCMRTVDARKLSPLLMGCPAICGWRDAALSILATRQAFEDAP